MDPPLQCAAGTYCEGQVNPNLTLGNHKCCKCKKFAHGLCIKELSDPSLSEDIKAEFARYESEAMTKEACLLCIQNVNDELKNRSTTPAAAVKYYDESNDPNYRRRAILEVLNMTRLNPTVFTAAQELAVSIGWSKKNIDIFLEESNDWAPKIEPAENHVPHDVMDEPEEEEDLTMLTYSVYKKRFATDVARFINASRAGEVSICSWYDHDKENVIITRLPVFQYPEIDYYRCEFFNTLMPGEYITLFHNSIVNYHQESSYSLKEDWCMGFNAHPSPYNFDFMGCDIYFSVKEIFEAVYKDVDFTNGPKLDHRDRVPSAEEIVNRIGPERFSDLVSFCRTNNICDCIKYLRENEGKHALLPGLWLSWETLVVSPHLFQVFDEMLQDWKERNETNVNDQDGAEEEEEENTGIEATSNKNKRKKKKDYINNYNVLYEASQSGEDFVDKCREYLNSDEGIMKMKRGELEGALGVWETRGHVYATLNLITAIEFFLTKQDRFKLYEREDVFEVNVMRKKCMDDAGVEPLTWSNCNRKARMKVAALFDQNIMIKPGNSNCPITGMTGVVYLKELEKCPIEVHRIILDHEPFQYDLE